MEQYSMSWIVIIVNGITRVCLGFLILTLAFILFYLIPTISSPTILDATAPNKDETENDAFDRDASAVLLAGCTYTFRSLSLSVISA